MYALPAVHVADTGTQDESITLKVERIPGGRGRAVPATWIHFADSRIQLSPHRETKIPLDLVVPASAITGSYLSDVVVIASAVVPSKATNFRAAAATKLEFRVVPGPKPGLFGSLPAWAWWPLAGLVLAALAGIGNRRYALQISIKRRQRGDGAASPGGASG